MQVLRAKSVIQLICMIAIIVVSTLHVDASRAAMKLDEAASFVIIQDDDQDDAGKIVADLCNFCSCTAAFPDVITPSSVRPVRRSVPSGRTRSLIAFQFPAIAPPPKS